MNRSTPEEIRASPFYSIAVSFQAFAILFSIHSLYRLSRKTITSKSIRIFLTAALVGNIVTQGYTIYHYNYDMTTYSFAIVWILVDGTIYATIMIDFMILRCYQPMNENISEKLILVMRCIYTIYFFACHAIAILFVFSIPVPNGKLLQELIGTFFVLSSIIYDNAQVCYLTYLVYSTKKRTSDKRIVNEALKKTIQLNVLVCGMDWVAMGLFFVQLVIPLSPATYIFQQISTSCATIHVSLVIFIFNRLKEFTFVGRKRKAAPVNDIAHAGALETFGMKPAETKHENPAFTAFISN